MAAQNWTIKIVPGEDKNVASFAPDVYTPSGIAPTSLQAQVADEVSWNDQTGQDHRLVLTDENFKPLVPETLITEIEAWLSSTTGYVTQAPVTGSIIYYACSLHTNEQGDTTEHGTITIVA